MIVFVGFVVFPMPFSVVVVDVLPAMGGVLSADYHGERAENRQTGDDEINTDPVMIAGLFHCIASIFPRANYYNFLKIVRQA